MSVRCEVAHHEHIRIQKQTTVPRQQFPLHPVHPLTVGAGVPDVLAQVGHVFVDVVAREGQHTERSSTVLANGLQTQVHMLRTLPLVRGELVVEPERGTAVERVVVGFGGGHWVGFCFWGAFVIVVMVGLGYSFRLHSNCILIAFFNFLLYQIFHKTRLVFNYIFITFIVLYTSILIRKVHISTMSILLLTYFFLFDIN